MDQLGGVLLPGEAEHGHERDDAGPAADQHGRSVAGPDKPAADRTPHFQFIPGLQVVVEEHRHFPPG